MVRAKKTKAIAPVPLRGALEHVEPCHNFIICGAGFGQRESDYTQGIFALTRYLHEKYSGPNLRVEMLHWTEDWAEKVDWIFGFAAGPNARILEIDYSWSVGNGLVHRAKEYERRGMKVERAVLADGVYHYGSNIAHELGIAQAIACTPRPWGRPQIHLPRGVFGDIKWFVQSPKNFRWLDYQTWLRGHKLFYEAGDGHSREEVPGKIEVEGVIHHWMDDCEPFQQAAMTAAEEMFGDLRNG